MLSLKTKNKSQEIQVIQKLLDITKHRRKTLKKEKEKQKMRKSQATTINTFFYNFYIVKFIFCWKTNLEKLSLF